MEMECDICKRRTERSTGYCTECKQAMCRECQHIHGGFSTTKYHTVLTPTNDTCSKHGLSVEYMCKRDIDVIMCCKKCEHSISDCSELMTLSDYFKNETVIEDKLKKNSAEIHQKLNALEIDFKLIKKRKITLEMMLNEVQHVKGTVDTINEILERQFNRCKSELEERQTEKDKFSDAVKQMNHKADILDILASFPMKVDKANTLMEIEDILRKNQSILNTSQLNRVHVFGCEENTSETDSDARSAFVKLLTLSQSLNKRYSDMQGDLDPEQETGRHSYGFQQELKEADLSDITACSITKPKVVESGPRKPRKRPPSETLEHYKELVDEKETDTLKSIEYRKHCSINVKTDGDTSICAITGLVELSDKTILMADFKNLKLKLFGADGHIVDTHSFTHEPRDIAYFDTDNLAVTIPMEKCIQFVSIKEFEGESKLVIGKRIDVSSLCCGISVSDNRIYTATQFPNRILVLNEGGGLIDEILGIGKFERPTYTLYDKTLSRIYVTDATHKCIYGFDANTKEGVFEYSVGHPHAIALDENGNLFVADWDTTSVHLVSKDAIPLAQIKLEPNECPQKLFYNKKKRCLFVTLWESNSVRIFNL